MSNDKKELSIRVVTLADLMEYDFPQADKGIVPSNCDNLYREQLPIAMKEIGAYHQSMKVLDKSLKDLQNNYNIDNKDLDNISHKVHESLCNNTTDVQKAVSTYEGQFAAAVALSFGRQSMDYCNKNKGFNRTTTSVVTHDRNSVDAVYDHSYQKSTFGKGEAETGHGRIRVSMSTHIQGKSAGDYATVKSIIADEFSRKQAD